MTGEEHLFFHSHSGLVPLYRRFREEAFCRWPKTTVKVQKTQITLMDPKGYAFVWLPFRKVKNRPDSYFILTFGLDRLAGHPRIVGAAHPSRNRWTHHVVMAEEADLEDDIIWRWLEEAHDLKNT